MIKEFDYPDAKSIVICGDIHGLLKRWCLNCVFSIV